MDNLNRAPAPLSSQMVAVAGALVTGAIIVTTLYFARDVLVPVALAVLLSFVLAPLVRVLQRARLPRVPAIALVVLIRFAVLSSLAGLMASQVTQLAGELPRYQETIRDKITSFRGTAASVGNSALERAADVLRDLRRELEKPPQNPFDRRIETPSEAASPVKPIPVEVRAPDPGPISTLTSFIAPLVHPLTTTGLVIIFVIFILAQREDLRNRMIRLAGAHDLQKTTAALDDAAYRLSRLFLAQLALNAGFGLLIGLGLYIIGIPSAALWGILAAVLRYVPYVGAFIAAAFPLALSVAVDPGWSMLLCTAALFIIIEPIIGHVIEPLLYGRSTGLSPIAVVVAATFWTWLWGPIGLVLATPLTVCLVVLGRHVERLQFLDVMFGDRPALSAPELFYQRTLAGDPPEISDKAAEYLKERPLIAYLDEVAMAGLRLAHADYLRGKLSETRQQRILGTVTEVVDDLSLLDPKPEPVDDPEAAAAIEEGDKARPNLPVLAEEDVAEAFRNPSAIVCLGARTALDDAGAAILSAAVRKHLGGVRVLESGTLSSRVVDFSDIRDVRIVCMSYVDVKGLAQLRYDVRRLRNRLPRSTIMLCCWDAPERLDDVRTQVGADLVVSNIQEAIEAILPMAREPAGQDVGAPATAQDVSIR